MGKFCLKQFNKNGIKCKGFICNDSKQWNGSGVYPPGVLNKDDIVVVCNFFYPQIKAQMAEMGLSQCIHYEELAYILPGLDTYYQAFDGMLPELEANKDKYIAIFDVLNDAASREIYEALLKYRITLDTDYTVQAFQKSAQTGIQDLDRVVVDRFTENTTFYDVGGFDGQSTRDFIQVAKKYKEIYFFEPDIGIIRDTQERLKEYPNIRFLQAAVGDKTGMTGFDSFVAGSGNVTEDGAEKVRMVCLDDYIRDGDSYVKMDVEGFEASAISGCEKAIKQYKPLLSISVYHKPGDIHRLIDLILSWNPAYKVYLRHYTQTYADTRAYFV